MSEAPPALRCVQERFRSRASSLRAVIRPILISASALAAIALAACGSSSPTHATSSGRTTSLQSALAAESRSAATGDIPDTQAFLVFSDAPAGYSVKYPEGWAQRGNGNDVTFQDKNNIIHAVVVPGGQPTAASVSAELSRERGSLPSLKAGAPRQVTLSAGPAIKVTYTTESAPNAVTGKRVTLTVDRYVLARGGRQATLDLGTQVGVDNVDAYRMIAGSFKWH
jgi:hypothetical protein